MTQNERDKLRAISKRIQVIVSAETFGTVEQCLELETIVEELDLLSDGRDQNGFKA